MACSDSSIYDQEFLDRELAAVPRMVTFVLRSYASTMEVVDGAAPRKEPVASKIGSTHILNQNTGARNAYRRRGWVERNQPTEMAGRRKRTPQ